MHRQEATSVPTRRERTYQLVEADASEAFPGRPGYKQWIRRLQRLLGQVGRLVRAAALRALRTETRRLYVADSPPIPVCKPIRHGRVRLLSEDGAKLGRSPEGWFFGFQIRASVHQPTGVVVTAIPLPTGCDDREAVQALAMSTGGGLLLVDRPW